MTDACLLTDNPRPTVRVQRQLTDPPPVVWQALTDRDHLRAWFPCDVIVTGGRWEVGAGITFPFPPEMSNLTLTGTVLEIDEPSVLAFTWGEETLRFELAAHAGGTMLVVTDEVPAAAAARNAAGWEACLDRLAGFDPGDAWQQRFEAYSASVRASARAPGAPAPGVQGRLTPVPRRSLPFPGASAW